MVKSPDDKTIVAYIPEKAEMKFLNSAGTKYSARWFNPVTNKFSEATNKMLNNMIHFTHDFENDLLIVLKKE